jgi:hypothetical protein
VIDINKQVIKYGHFDWRVLDEQDGKILIITEYVIDVRKYHEASNATWHECSLRHFLNGEFLDQFNSVDKEKIALSVNKNLANPWYQTNGGKDSNDKIFLLSLEDVCKYFGDSRLKLRDKGNQDMIDDFNNVNRKAMFNNNAYWWWLRSVGHDNGDAARVSRSGRVDVRGDYIDDGIGGGVRPALWLQM